MISSINIRGVSSSPTSRLLSIDSTSNQQKTNANQKDFVSAVSDVKKQKDVTDNNDVKEQAQQIISQLLFNLQSILQNNKMNQSDDSKKSDSVDGTDNSKNKKLDTVLSSLSPSDKQRVMNDVQKLMNEMNTGSMDNNQKNELSNILNMLGQTVSSGGGLNTNNLNTDELRSKLEEVKNKISEAIKEDDKTTSIKSNSSSGVNGSNNTTNNSDTASKISSVVSNVVSKINSSSTSSDSSKANQIQIGTNTDTHHDNSLFKIILDNSNSESKGDLNKRSDDSSSLLSSIVSTKDDKGDNNSNFGSLLQGVSSTVSHISDTPKENMSKPDESGNNVQQSNVSHETNNSSSNVVQSKNLSLTVSTGDDQPVRVQINRTEAGISSLSLQAADEHTTESLQKTQHILSHQLEISGIHPSSVKITVLPTDTGNQTNANSQNMNQNSFFQNNSNSFSSNSGGEHHGHRNEIQYYGNSLGNVGADDVYLDEETNDLTEYRGLNIKV